MLTIVSLLTLILHSAVATGDARNILALKRNLAELRCTANMLAFRIASGEPRGSWIVARLLPDRQVRLPGDTGPQTLRYSGKCEQAVPLAFEPSGAIDRYEFERPGHESDERGTGFDSLVLGGAIVGRVDLLEGGSVTFGPVVPIPDEWRMEVKEAFAYLRTHPRLLAREPEDIASAERLLKGDNPILAIAAFRALVAADPANQQLATLVKIDSGRQPFLVYLILNSGSPSAGALVQSDARTASSARCLRHMALGAYAVATESGTGAPRRLALDVLRAVRVRARELSNSRGDGDLEIFFSGVICDLSPTETRPGDQNQR